MIIISTEKALEKNFLSTKKEKNQENYGKTFGRNPQIFCPHAHKGAWLTFKPSQSFPRGNIVEELDFTGLQGCRTTLITLLTDGKISPILTIWLYFFQAASPESGIC